MKEEWLFHGAVVPIDVETTAALVAEIKRLIYVIGGMALAQPEHEPVAYLCENAVGHKYFRWKKPSSTYKPIALYTSPPAQRTWVGLMRGVRVEGDTLVITVKGGNDVARELCGALIEEMNK